MDLPWYVELGIVFAVVFAIFYAVDPFDVNDFYGRLAFVRVLQALMISVPVYVGLSMGISKGESWRLKREAKRNEKKNQ
jgi:hypothetical protein